MTEPDKSKVRLIDASDAEIKTLAARLGYDFSDDDCADLRKTQALWNIKTETLWDAVNDYLDAFER